MAGVDTLTCVSLITAAALAFGTSVYYATNPDIARTQAEAIGELAGGLADVLIPSPVPYDQETFSPPPPNPCSYNPGPALGGEFTGPLHLPGPTLEIPPQDTTLDFPLLEPGEVEGNILFISRQQALKIMGGLSIQVEIHLRKIANEPDSQAAKHWRSEVENWINEIERLSTHVGKKTQVEWAEVIENWRSRLGD